MGFTPGQQLTDAFRHSAGTTGIVDGSFTKNLFYDNATASETVTVTEISGGFYGVDFTPTAGNEGHYYLNIEEPSTGIFHTFEYRTVYDDESIFIQSSTTAAQVTTGVGSVEVNNVDFTATSFEHWGRKLVWTSGNNDGDEYEILYIDDNKRMYLNPRVTNTVGIGDTFNVFFGSNPTWTILADEIATGGDSGAIEVALPSPYNSGRLVIGREMLLFDTTNAVPTWFSSASTGYNLVSGNLYVDTTATFAADDLAVITSNRTFDANVVTQARVEFANDEESFRFIIGVGVPDTYDADGAMVGLHIEMIDGLGAGQVRKIVKHEDVSSTTSRIYFDQPFAGIPARFDIFNILRFYDAGVTASDALTTKKFLALK